MSKRTKKQAPETPVTPLATPAADEREWIVRDADLKILGRVTGKTHRAARSAARTQFGAKVQVELPLEAPANAAANAEPPADAGATEAAEAVPAPTTSEKTARAAPTPPQPASPTEGTTAVAPATSEPAVVVHAESVAAPTPNAEAPAKARKSRKTRAEPEARKAAAPPKKLSALDAADRVLREEGKPMNCQEMVEAMARKGYWESPGGRTPAATLYSAILRELATKGDQARFEKTERGRFKARGV